MADSGLWQHPFVNVFKLCDAEHGKNAHHEGDVLTLLDKEIGKKVMRVWGNIPAANYLSLPKQKTASLGLTGRFLYMQVKPFPPKVFAVHLEVLTTTGHLVRISVANLFKKKRDQKEPEGNRKHVTLPWLPVEHKWTMLALDLPRLVEEHSGLVFQSLKSLQLCSYLLVRGAFTSDLKYTAGNLPREMALPGAEAAEPLWHSHWLPAEPPTHERLAPATRQALQERNGNVVGEGGVGAVKVVKHRMLKNPTQRVPNSPGFTSLVPADEEGVGPDELVSPVRPEPVMQLQHCIGMSGEHPRALAWCPGGREVAFVSNNTVIVQDTQTGVQRFLLGHTADVVALAFSGDGATLATAQEGKTAMIRVWNFATGACAAVLCGHASALTAVDVSQDGRAVVGVGLDAYKHQMLVIWDISKCLQGEKAKLIVKHTTEFHVKCVKFSPFEEDRLFTCGVDSIRSYRLKGGQLRGISIQLGAHRHASKKKGDVCGPLHDDLVRNTFTDIAFETGYGLMELTEKHLFVSSVSGAVFQLNYGRRCLECVYQLHNAAINSLTVSEGFCVTGGDDRFLRVWPVDFTDFFLEAEHEASVVSVGVSSDGLQLAIGTENGSVGLLDIPTHKYATLLRSHTKAVNAVALDPHNPHMLTAASDGSIRVWDLETFHQLLEFVVPGENVLCAAYHPHLPLVACGFGKGLVRVFSVTETRMVIEHKQHKGGVRQLLFSPDGSFLFTAGEEGNLCVYDTAQNFLPIKYLATSLPSCHAAMAIAPNGSLLASLGSDASYILLFDAHTLTPFSRMDIAGDMIANLAFSPDSRELLLTTQEMRLERYEVATGRFLAGAGKIHRTACEALAVHPNGGYVFTGGHDRLVKVWPYHLERYPHIATLAQSYMGASDSVGTIAVDPIRGLVVTAGASDAVMIWKFYGEDTGVLADMPMSPMAAELEEGEIPPTPNDAARAPEPRPTDTVPPPQLQTLAELAALSLEAGTTQSGSAVVEARAPVPAVRPAERAVKLAAMRKTLMVGYSGPQGNATVEPQTLVWEPALGLFAYPIANLVVLEDLRTRQQRHLAGHRGAVNCLALASVAGVLASGGAVEAPGQDPAAGDIRLWDVNTGDALGVLHYHNSSVQAMEFSPSGRVLVSLGSRRDEAVVVWNVHHKDVIAVAQTDTPMHAIVWRPEAVLSEFFTSNSKEVVLWTLEDTPGSPALASHTTVLPAAAPERSYTSLAALDPANVLVGDTAGGLWRVDTAHGALHWHLGPTVDKALEGPVKCLWASSAGKVVCGGGSPGSVAVWVQRVPLEPSLVKPEDPDLWCMAWQTQLDGDVLTFVLGATGDEAVVSTKAGTIWYIDLAEHVAAPLLGGHPADVASLSVSNDGALMATAAADGTLRMWETKNFAKLMQFEMPGLACRTLAISQGGDTCTVGYHNGTVCVWDLATVQVVGVATAHDTAVTGVAYLADERHVLTAAADGRLALVDTALLEVVAVSDQFASHPGSLAALVPLPLDADHFLVVWADRLEVVACSVGADRSLTLTLTGASLTLDPTPAATTAASPATASAPVLVFSKYEPHIALFTSPATAEQILFFDTAKGEVVRSLALHTTAASLALSPDGRLLAVGYADGAVRVCGYTKEMYEAEREGFVEGGAIDTLAFIGNRKLVGSSRQVLHVWGVEVATRA